MGVFLLGFNASGCWSADRGSQRRTASRTRRSVAATHRTSSPPDQRCGRWGFHFSLSFCTCAPLAGPGAYCSRTVIFFPLSSVSLVFSDPCGRGGVRGHLHERTRTGGTEPARHPPLEVVQVSAGRDGAVHPQWTPRNRRRAARAGAMTFIHPSERSRDRGVPHVAPATSTPPD
jgi:hypothetical protein